MKYSVKEIHYTLQGEGAKTGRPAVLLRFAGCNLWSGREQDRSDAVCNFCDTDIVGTDGHLGGSYASAGEVAGAVESIWPAGERNHRFVICTGGEPLLQLDRPLIDRLQGRHYRIEIYEPYLYLGGGNEPFSFMVDLHGEPAGTVCLDRSGYPWAD